MVWCMLTASSFLYPYHITLVRHRYEVILNSFHLWSRNGILKVGRWYMKGGHKKMSFVLADH
jgi:hypothetical protein